MKTLLLIILFQVVTVCHLFAQCGVERITVKDYSDGVKIDFTNARTTTIKEQIVLKAPKVTRNLPRQKDESEYLKITATIIGYKIEADKDFHIVISENSKTMICEIPSPDCAQVKKGLRYAEIKKAREDFIAKFGKVTSTFRKCNVRATLYGCGFYDMKHAGKGQIGHAENNREIHAVDKIEFQ